MIVAVAAGMQPNLTFNPMEPAATITAYIVQVALGDLPHGIVGYQTIFAAGLTLFLLTLVFNLIGLLDAQALPGGLLTWPLPIAAARTCTRADSGAPRLIAKAKRWDVIFVALGMLALGIGLAHLRRAVRRHADRRLAAAAPGVLHAVPVAPRRAGGHPLGVGRHDAGDAGHRGWSPCRSASRAGVYLEEYAPKNWITDIIEINITNLAGVPSIVYGLLALGLFVYQFGLGQSILTAGLTLALLILPVVIVATREAIRAIPAMHPRGRLRAGRHQVADGARPHPAVLDAGHPDRRHHRHVARHRRDRADHHHRRAHLHRLPAAVAGHGRLRRSVTSTGCRSPFTVMPIQMFNWTSRPEEAFHVNAAAAGLDPGGHDPRR